MLNYILKYFGKGWCISVESKLI